MPKPFSLRRLIGKKLDVKIDKGQAPDTIESTSSPIPRQGSRNQEQKAGSVAANTSLRQELPPDKYGLILLNEDSGLQAPKYNIDVVAVHGLGGGAYTTWRHDNGTLWLRDSLLKDLPSARVFTYGYDSAFVFSRGTSTLRDFARALLEDVRSERRLSEVCDNYSYTDCNC
jgi:hypothetical protein